METSDQASRDHGLQEPIVSFTGLRKGLALYGDAQFSLFLRKVCKALGYYFPIPLTEQSDSHFASNRAEHAE
jgi:hypothetical protein